MQGLLILVVKKYICQIGHGIHQNLTNYSDQTNLTQLCGRSNQLVVDPTRVTVTVAASFIPPCPPPAGGPAQGRQAVLARPTVLSDSDGQPASELP